MQDGAARTFTVSSAFCSCSAWRGVLGLEPTPELYVQHLVEIFREVRRVLRADGTCWVNLGDSYAGQLGWRPEDQRTSTLGPKHDGLTPMNAAFIEKPRRAGVPDGLKPKDLVGIPWRVAFALQADGWWLRSDIIWAKPNPMPESITDRPTKSHEYLFLLTKAARYYYDGEAIKEKQDQEVRYAGTFRHGKYVNNAAFTNDGSLGPGEAIYTELNGHYGRNRRSVWTMAEEETEWIGRLGVCRRCNGLRIAGPGWERTTIKDTDDSGHQASAPPTEPSTRPSSDLLGQDSRSTTYVRTRDTSIPTTSNLSLFESTSSEATHLPLAISPRESVPKVTPTVPTTRIDAVMVGGNVVSACVCGDGDNSRGSVWQIATEPFAAAHFATFPQALVEPCILAGTSERGACPACGAPWLREVERRVMTPGVTGGATPYDGHRPDGMKLRAGGFGDGESRTLNWSSVCACLPADPVPCRVLDPFAGSGTTVAVAERLGRVGIGVELKAAYLRLAWARTRQAGLL
jgi:DNA modification methylase